MNESLALSHEQDVRGTGKEGLCLLKIILELVHLSCHLNAICHALAEKIVACEFTCN